MSVAPRRPEFEPDCHGFDIQAPQRGNMQQHWWERIQDTWLLDYDDLRTGKAAGEAAARKRPTPKNLFQPKVPKDTDKDIDKESFLRGYWRGLAEVVEECAKDAHERRMALMRLHNPLNEIEGRDGPIELEEKEQVNDAESTGADSGE